MQNGINDTMNGGIMMKRMKALLTAAAVACTALAASVYNMPQADVLAADQVNIMPIGDSITFGLGDDGGYRKFLDYALKSKGYTFDMVGPEGQNAATFSYNGQTVTYDNNHAGYSGFTIKQQYPIPSWGENGLLERLQQKDAIKNAQPDIVLLIIGTNDMTANRDLDACDQDLHTLIDYILGDLPEGGIIFMGSIPDFEAYGGNAQRVANYNAVVKRVAESYGDNVQFADVHSSLSMADMQNDKLHPSSGGYEKMGKYWAEVIDEYLSSRNDDPDNPEVLHSDFEGGLSGWKARGNASVQQTKQDAAEGAASALVTDRASDWNGITYALSSKRCPAGQHISVQAKIMHKSDSPVHFKMSMQYDNNGTAVYDTFAEMDAAPGEWLTFSCLDYEMQDGSSPMLYFETEDSLCDFWLDEVIVTKTDGAAPTEPETEPYSEPETPTEIDTEPETEPETVPETVKEPETQPASAEVQKGDNNGDGSFGVADVILLQKWLSAVPGVKLENPDAADLNEDGSVDVFDLGLMKRLLLGQ